MRRVCSYLTPIIAIIRLLFVVFYTNLMRDRLERNPTKGFSIFSPKDHLKKTHRKKDEKYALISTKFHGHMDCVTYSGTGDGMFFRYNYKRI
jgi:hypothetical protein